MARLYVICGHGEGDPGAGGCGYDEAERVRVLGSAIKRLGGDAVDMYPQGQKCVNRGDLKRIKPGCPVIELHLDCAGASARGGHVIIKAGTEPDAYDNALAAYLAREFPGRANMIVGRNDLGDVNDAYNAGTNYRLVEFCFISNQADMDKFNSHIDDIARAVLACFGIESEDDMSWDEKLHGWNGDIAARDRLAGADKASNDAATNTEKILKQLTTDGTGRTSGAMPVNERLSHMMNHIEATEAKQAAHDEAVDAKLDAIMDALGIALGELKVGGTE